MNLFQKLRLIAKRIGGSDGDTVRQVANSLEHIGLDDTFVPIPKNPGYFWNKQERRLYSIKIAGAPRALKQQKYIFGKSWKTQKPRVMAEKPHYKISENGQVKVLTVEQIERLVA
tara:strand:- start:178 stop:522 length:345 start_codon:yes stop_codon:yes gene_type:complete